MDRLITTAWRAFWVALGGSVVLVGQAAFFPAPRLPAAAPAPALVAPAPDKPAISQRRVVVDRDRVVVRS